MSLNDRKQKREYNQTLLAFEAEKRLLDMLKSHGDAHLAIHKQRTELCKNMFMYLLFESGFETQLQASLYNLRIEEYGLIKELAGFERDARRETNDKKSKRYQQIQKAYEKEQNVLEEQIASLERMAVIAMIDLKDAGRDEVFDFNSADASEAVPLIRAASVVRGSSGGGLGWGRGRGS
jgi:hypothetical protein